MKKITIQEAFSLEEWTSFHVFIKDDSLVDNLFKVLEEKGVFWKSGKKPFELRKFMGNRIYPVVLTVNKSPEKTYMTYSDDVTNPYHIDDVWSVYSTKGYVLVDEEMLKLKIKRKDKI